MEERYISVAEFAKMAGVSRQAVYSRLDSKEFTKYVKVDSVGKGRKKLVSTGALEFFQQKEVKQVDSQVDNVFVKDDSIVDSLIEALKDELKQKDKVIEAQQKQIQDLMRLLDQQQQLHALLTKQLALSESKEVESEITETKPVPEDVTEKKGWFARLFSR